MGLPERITFQDERYPYIVLTPVGENHKHIRSIGHKFERSLLSRVNDAVSVHFHENEGDFSKIRRYLKLTDKALLPIAFQKEETIHPYLLRPEMFLWRTFPGDQGLPFQENDYYHIDFTQLSAEQLHEHVGKVLLDYSFLAEVSKNTKAYWLNRITKAFHKHPFIKFIHQKKDVVDAVEVMNQSALLSVLRYPEDVAFWRKRVETVMRPYRFFPSCWLDKRGSSCEHEKVLSFESKTKTITCVCDHCNLVLHYGVDDDRIRFTEHLNVDLAKKRMITIEKQFNEIAEKNTWLIDQLQQLSILKKQLTGAGKTLSESLKTVQLIERYRKEKIHLNSYPILYMYSRLRDMTVPVRKSPSYLVWMAGVKLEDINILKELPHWQKVMPEHVYPLTNHILEELTEKLEEVKYSAEDVIMTIQGRPLTYALTQQVLDLIHYYGTEYPAHTLVQVLAGKATNKIRSLHLHETRWFGLLAEWPEKYIQRLFNQLEKQGWLMKQRKGYSVSDFAEEVM